MQKVYLFISYLTIIVGIFNSCPYGVCGQEDPDECEWSACGDQSCDESHPYKWATGRCDFTARCSEDQTRLYCCKSPTPYDKTYWLGTPPECRATCEDCKVNDECVIKSEPCGDDDRRCDGGRGQVLCGQLKPTELLRNIPWYWYLVGAAFVVGVAIIGIGGATYICCVGCNCCSGSGS